MQKFIITTKQDSEKAERSEHQFRDQKAATDDAQVALSEMVRDKLPNGSRADFGAKVENEAGETVYRASLNFNAETGEEIIAAEKQADEAADDVAKALRGKTRE
jgi:hypothetical protein